MPIEGKERECSCRPWERIHLHDNGFKDFPWIRDANNLSADKDCRARMMATLTPSLVQLVYHSFKQLPAADVLVVFSTRDIFDEKEKIIDFYVHAFLSLGLFS